MKATRQCGVWLVTGTYGAQWIVGTGSTLRAALNDWMRKACDVNV